MRIDQKTKTRNKYETSKSILFKIKSFIRPNEWVNGLTHLLGVFLAFPGLYMLIHQAPAGKNLAFYISLYIFGISLFLLYMASTTYHLLNISERCTINLRRIDHMMIYILIAGSYTPICIIALPGWWGWGLLIAVWSLTLAGICLKIWCFNTPRWLSTLLYILMGWMVIIALYPLYLRVSFAGILWLALGGLSYTVGAVIYALKKPAIKIKYLGFHEIFHVFVLMGSFCHYWMVYRYLVLV
ncbi:putative membrane protein hemolysin iii [hydrocarbon metagenome]|uniref:Putative membrane protein hemolysin iii n=1 Tax=hydrocarbon metagenome TaxID=938273 RepID=A0A0W8E4Z9_9ZZZZ